MTPINPHDELRRERLRRGWLRPELVEKLQQWEDERGSGKLLPVDRNYLYRWETGRRGVSEFYAIRLEAVLGIPRHRLIDRRTLRHAGSLGRQDADKPAGRAQIPCEGEFRKTLLKLATAVLPDPDRLAGSQVVDPLLLHDLQVLTDDFAQRHHQARPQAIVGPLGAHLRHLCTCGALAQPQPCAQHSPV